MKILVAGSGNIFQGDHGFGCEVIHALNHVQLPGDVTIRDFGTRNYGLAYALAEDYDIKILVDAVPQNSAPGTVYLIEPDLNRLNEMKSAEINPHSMNPIAALQMARSFGDLGGKFYVVGCEPAVPDEDNGETALSKPMRDAVPEAVRVICMLVADALSEPDMAVEFEFSVKE